nr:uncharacterized protein LOC129381528 [Dermacentor andersoni]
MVSTLDFESSDPSSSLEGQTRLTCHGADAECQRHVPVDQEQPVQEAVLLRPPAAHVCRRDLAILLEDVQLAARPHAHAHDDDEIQQHGQHRRDVHRHGASSSSSSSH